MTPDSKEIISLALVFIAGGLMFLGRRQIIEALEAFRNFRGGGPRPPSHPLPANDAFLIRRKRRRPDLTK